MRYYVIQALGRIGDPKAADALRPLLTNERGQLQEDVAAAIGALKCREAVPELLQQLKVEDNHRSVLPALAEIGDKTVAPELIRRLEAGGCSSCYPDALVRLKSTEAIPSLRKLWEKERAAGGSGVHMAGILAKLGDTSCLVQLLAPGEKDRTTAAAALVRSGDSRGVGPLLESSELSSQTLAFLNALRKPEKTAKLGATKDFRTTYGSRRWRIERFAGGAGFQVRWEGFGTLASKLWATTDVVLDSSENQGTMQAW